MADTMELLRISTMLSKLGDLEAAEATEKLTAIMNGYRLETEDAIKVTDTLIALDNSLATSTQAIADGMAKASSMANAAGVSYQNLATFIGVTQAVTQQSGETVGQAYKTMLARFQQVKAGAKIFEQDGEVESINNVEKALRAQNIEIRDSAGSFRELDDVIPEVAAKYEELMAAGRDVEAKQIVGAIAGVRQINMIETLLQNWDLVIESQNEVAENMGLTTSRYNIYLDSIEAKSNELKATAEEMWSKTISDDTIKDVIELGIGVLKLINGLGGLVPILGAIAAVLFVIKIQSVGGAISQVITYIPRLVTMLVLWRQGMLGVAGATMAANAATALATGGISVLVAGLVLLITNLDKILPSMTNLNNEFQKNRDIANNDIDELNSLASEYENLANKADKSSEDLVRLLDIQTILNTKYGAVTDGINTYTDAIDGNSEAIEENIRWMKESAELKAKTFLAENKRAYDKAQEYLSESGESYRGVAGLGGEITGSPEERLAELNKAISSGDNTSFTRNMAIELQKQISAAQQLVIDYEHYNNVLEANTDIVETNTSVVETNTSVVETSKQSFESLSSAMDAVSSASKEQADNGRISYATALDLISANASLAQYLTKTADGYIFDAEAAKTATQAEMINEFTKYGLRDAAIAAANGNYIFAQSAIAASNATDKEKASMLGLLKAFSAMNVSISIPSGGGSSGKSAIDAANDAQKKLYENEIKSINKQKDAYEDKIKALENLKDAYNDIIDAKKESLRLTKEETDYQSELKDKNKQLAEIDNELLQLQFDNSEEANARRLELEAERAEKVEEINQMQADRTYDIQIEALDAEAEAYEKMIDAQIAGLDRVISKFDIMIEKITEMIAALAELASVGGSYGGSYGGGGYYTDNGVASSGLTPEQKAAAIKANIAKRAKRNPLAERFASGGAFETTDSASGDTGVIRVDSNEVGLILNRPQQNALAPMASLFYTIMKNAGTSPQFSNTGGNAGSVSIGDINLSVNGSLDKTILPDLKETIMKAVVDATNSVGIRRNAKSFTI